MINLKEKIAQLIAMMEEGEKDSLLSLETGDQMEYYKPTIQAAIKEEIGRELNINEWDQFSFLSENVIVQGYGIWNKPGSIPICRTEEMEVDPGQLEEMIGKITPWRKEVINRCTDIYINDNGYGYVTSDIRLEIKTDIDTLTELLIPS